MNDTPRTIQRKGEYIRIPEHRGGGTGGREYWSGRRIQAIRQMASNGTFESAPDALFRFNPLQDGEPKAPYTIEERLIVVPPFDTLPLVASQEIDLSTQLAPSLALSQPIILGEYSYGATTGEIHQASAQTAENLGIIFGIGEGGWYQKIRHHTRIMVQVASGVFGITAEVLQNAVAISIKMAQSAKPGVGGHVVARKITKEMAETRGMPFGIDYISDANRIFSIEEVRQIVASVRKASKGKPIFIKCAATHDLGAIVSGAVTAGADGVIIDGRGGGTGAGPLIIKNKSCMPIELAVAIAHNRVCALGMRDHFKIIATGRIDLPGKALKLILLGADAVMLGTAALVAMGCLMVHMCHKKCPALITTAIGSERVEKRIDSDWATHVLTSFVRVFGEALKAYAHLLGVSKITNLVGRKDLLQGVALDPELYELMGIQSLANNAIESEVKALWKPHSNTIWHPWQEAHLTYLAQEGSTEIGSMGRTTDLDPPRSYLDSLIIEGRHVVGPAVDAYRDNIELMNRLPGNVKTEGPIMIPITSKENAIDVLKTVSGRKIIATISYELVLQLQADPETKSEVNGRLSSLLIQLPNTDVLQEHNETLKHVAGISIPHDKITRKTLQILKTIGMSDRPVYASLFATGHIERDIAKLLEYQIAGIIVEGKIGIHDFEFGTEKELPLEIAIPFVDKLLGRKVQNGKIARTRLALIASGNVRTPDDICMLCALGSNGVIDTELEKKTGTEKLGATLDGYATELRAQMGAGGISMITSLIGNRDLLRADEIPANIRELIGVYFMGR